MTMLGYTPLLDPLTALYPGLSDYWLWLLVPLVIAISVIYKAIRVHKLGDLPKESLRMSIEIFVFMAIAAFAVAGLHWVWIRFV